MSSWLIVASAGGGEVGVSAAVTGMFAALLVALIACLALEEKLHAKKSVIAGSFALLTLLLGAVCGILPFDRVAVGSHEVVDHDGLHGHARLESEGVTTEVDIEPDHEADGHAHRAPAVHVDGHRLAMPVYIPGIDWGVIAIIVGSSLFVDVTSRSGLFTWIAIKVTKASGGDPRRLLYCYGLMTVAFSAVLNNVTAMIIVGSLTAVSLDKLRQREKLLGFLLVEGLLTNIGGLLTLISSVPNIIVGTAAQISFVTFFLKAGPFVLAATLLTLWLGARLFKIEKLTSDEARRTASDLVRGFDETDGVESWGFFWFAAAMLGLFIVTIATTSVLPYVRHLEMGFVALAFAGVMLLRYKSEADDFYKAIDWDLIGFFMALFVVIYVMEHAQVLHAIGQGLTVVVRHIGDTPATISDSVAVLVGSAVFSSVTDNIPLAAMLANILTQLQAPIATPQTAESGLWWAVVFGANLGGNLTPIGSASTLVAVTIMHKHELHVSFARFVRLALPYALLHIGLATLYVLCWLR